jgi:hypothetical protein
MTEGRYCSRTIKRSSFTAEDFGRDVFDAVIERLEEHGYIKFEKGKRQAYSKGLLIQSLPKETSSKVV